MLTEPGERIVNVFHGEHGAEFKGYLNFDHFSANCSFAWNYDIKAEYYCAYLIREIRLRLKHPDKRAWEAAMDIQDSDGIQNVGYDVVCVDGTVKLAISSNP